MIMWHTTECTSFPIMSNILLKAGLNMTLDGCCGTRARENRSSHTGGHKAYTLPMQLIPNTDLSL